jgi:predicted dehydrogenase
LKAFQYHRERVPRASGGPDPGDVLHEVHPVRPDVDVQAVLFRFDNGARGVLIVSQVSAGRKNRLYFEMDGSKKAVAWESEAPNSIWIGKRDGNNGVMMKVPSLVYPEVRSLISFPGGHNQAFPDTSKQMFRDVYDYIASGAKGRPLFPTFEDGLRELALCERILSSKGRNGCNDPDCIKA